MVHIAIEARGRAAPKGPLIALAGPSLAPGQAIGIEAPCVEGAALLLDGPKRLRAVADAVAAVVPEAKALGRRAGPVPSVATDGVPVDRLVPALA